VGDTVEPDDLRIGGSERDAAVAILGDHFAAERLEAHEYEQRVAAALQARTWGDLRPLFQDLPPAGTLFPTPRTTAVRPESWRLPDRLRTTLTAEGLLLLDENLRGSITFRRYRAPGQYSGWERTKVFGTVAVTRRRLLVWAAHTKQVDVPFDHPRRTAVTLSVEKPDRLCIEADAGAFHPDRSGRIEYRFRTRNAATIRALAGSS
jgi:hypothetical protein